MNRIQAFSMLAECTGDELWSIDYCKQRGVPDIWIEELADGFESNFRRESQTIYVEDRRVNQYEGIRDIDLACRLGAYVGVDIDRILAASFTRRQVVQAIREAIEEE